MGASGFQVVRHPGAETGACGAHCVTVHRFSGVRQFLGTGQHVADHGSVEITGEVAGAVIAQYRDRETQLAGVAKAETGNSGSATGTARAVRRVTTGAIRAAQEAGGGEFTNGDQPEVRLGRDSGHYADTD